MNAKKRKVDRSERNERREQNERSERSERNVDRTERNVDRSQRSVDRSQRHVDQSERHVDRSERIVDRNQPRTSFAGLGVLEDAKIVVGIDFGTTFSGFAYASMTEPDNVYTFYDWPYLAAAGSKPYCKTQTSLFYLPGKTNGTYDLQSWGWEAQVKHCKALQEKKSHAKGMAANSKPAAKRPVDSLGGSQPSCGYFLAKFKLLLDQSNPDQPLELEELPEGLSPTRVISDYLKQLSIFILKELRKRYGSLTQKKDVKWCLTVPTIWSDVAKQTMIDCAEMAGLVHGRLCPVDEDASLHKIDIVLEPEAASIYCLQKKDFNLRKGGKFLVVDAGGGTVDLVVHQKMDESGLRVKEVTVSTGGLCGGTLVDRAFLAFLAQRIECFDSFSEAHPSTILTIKGYWETLKCSFDGEGDPSSYLELPAKLADAWEVRQKADGSWTSASQYDEIVITREDMKSFFDGEVNQIINLIREQLILVPDIEVIAVVGGFSNSAYLMKRIRDQFEISVKQIISPTDPGSAVCQGAVAFGTLGPDVMMSRVSRKTYGVALAREFQRGDPPESMIFDDDGKPFCGDTFWVFSRIGDDVPVDHCVTHQARSLIKKEERILFTMYSTIDSQPAFVTDRGVVKVGSFTFHLPPEALNMDERAAVDVTMYFGRTHIQLSATPANFNGGPEAMVSIVFERDLR